MRLTLLILALLAMPFAAGAGTFATRPDVQHFIQEMVARNDFDAARLAHQFERVKPLPRVAKTMTGAYLKPPSWESYRANFVNPRNIQRGVEFWNAHGSDLGKAREVYGVDEAVIVAILGIETRYGRYPATHRTFDALATLAFDYPRRAAFYRNELEQFLLLAREEKRDPFSFKGSFAGALGIPQFMPSSYRTYGVDFDGDGRRDLLTSTCDAIGSVAAYLAAYGWVPNMPVATQAQLRSTVLPANWLSNGLKPDQAFSGELAATFEPVTPLGESAEVALFAVEGETGTEYWLGLNNFYVITRYNRSLFYALAVHQLAEEIRAARRAAQT